MFKWAVDVLNLRMKDDGESVEEISKIIPPGVQLPTMRQISVGGLWVTVITKRRNEVLDTVNASPLASITNPFTYNLTPSRAFSKAQTEFLLRITNHSETEKVDLENNGKEYPDIDDSPHFDDPDGFYLALKGGESLNNYLVSDDDLPNVVVSVINETGWKAERREKTSLKYYWIIHPETKSSIAPKKTLEVKIKAIVDEEPGDCFVYIDARIKGGITKPAETLKVQKYLEPKIISFDFSKTDPLLIGEYATFSWVLQNAIGCRVTLDEEVVSENSKQLELIPKTYVLVVYNQDMEYRISKDVTPKFEYIRDAYISAYDYVNKTVTLTWKLINTEYCDIAPEQSGVTPSALMNQSPEGSVNMTLLSPYLNQYTFNLTAYERKSLAKKNYKLSICPPNIISFTCVRNAKYLAYVLRNEDSIFMPPQELNVNENIGFSYSDYEPPPPPPPPRVTLSWSISNFDSAYCRGIGSITASVGSVSISDYWDYTLEVSNDVDGYYDGAFKNTEITIKKTLNV